MGLCGYCVFGFFSQVYSSDTSTYGVVSALYPWFQLFILSFDSLHLGSAWICSILDLKAARGGLFSAWIGRRFWHRRGLCGVDPVEPGISYLVLSHCLSHLLKSRALRKYMSRCFLSSSTSAPSIFRLWYLALVKELSEPNLSHSHLKHLWAHPIWLLVVYM